MRTRLLAAVFFLFLWQDCALADDTLVGVNYFAGWWKELPNKWHGQGWNVKDPDWRPKYPERVPLLGQYNDQATMDREIVAAADHGVDFFAILYYFPMSGSPEEKYAPRLNRGLETFLSSTNSAKMKFCIEYCNAKNFSARDDKEWNECVATWIKAMRHPSYLRVDGRLVFKVHGVTQFLRTNDNDLDLCRKRLDTLRGAARSAGLGEMLIGVGISGETPPLGKKWPPAELFDFTGTYMSVPGVEPRDKEYAYSLVADQQKASLKTRLTDPIPWMPYLAAGWNPRPWTHPRGARHHRTFFTFPTREEFTDELEAMKESLSAHPSLGLPKKDGTQQKAFTIYAWNEFGEGGIVAPTKGNGYMMLECIRDVFGAGDYDPLATSAKATYTTVDIAAQDKSGDRDIPLRIYLPATSSPAPVILFSHGLGGSREGSSYLGKHWAKRGYVAVFLQHPGSDTDVWTTARAGSRFKALKEAANARNFILRAKDVPAVLDQLARWNKLAGHKLHGRMDLEKVGMSGHSFGAVTTQAVSGQRFRGEQSTFTDKRIVAALPMSPSSSRGSTPRESFGSVTIPWMLMTGTKDTSPIGNTDVESRLAVFPALPPGDKYELVLFEAEHSAFTDHPPRRRSSRNPNHHRAILALSTAFWDTYLREDSDAKAWLDSDRPRSVLEERDTWKKK